MEWDGVQELPSVSSMLRKSAWYKYNMFMLPNCAPHKATNSLYAGVTADGVSFVIKVAAQDSKPEAALEIERERAIGKLLLPHPNIMPQLAIPGFEQFYLVLPRFQHDLGFIARPEMFMCVTDRHRSGIMSDITTALAYLASHNLVHGDVKFQNMYINTIPAWSQPRLGVVVLGDFGCTLLAQRVNIADVQQLRNYRVGGGAGLQTVHNVTMFLSDMLQCVKHVMLPLMGLEMQTAERSDVLVAIGRTSIDLAVQADSFVRSNYASAMSDYTLLSDVCRAASGVLTLNPMRYPRSLPRFVKALVCTRVRCFAVGSERALCSAILPLMLHALITFPRASNAKTPAYAEAAWHELRAVCTDVHVWYVM